MALLSQATKGKVKKPHLVLIYGPDGCGKTTFGASAPKPIIIGPESGSSNLDVTRLEPKSFTELLQVVDELRSTAHYYETAVFDSLDWIEPQVWRAVCEKGKVDSIELFGGGYGKGYQEALTTWRKFMDGIRQLREEKKMNVVLIAHSQVKAFNDPSQPVAYDRYMLKLNDKAAALWREFVDSVLFATFEVFTKPDGNKAKAFGDGERIVYTEWRPFHDAKNRFNLPTTLPLSWTAYDQAVNADREASAPQVREAIQAMLTSVSDKTLKTQVSDFVEKAGNDVNRLVEIKNRLSVRVGA